MYGAGDHLAVAARPSPLRQVAGHLLAALLFLAPAAAAAETTKITFLHVNDVNEIEPRRGAGGFAPLMTLLERERAASVHTITTFGGDLLSPSLLSGFTKGAHMVELMNAIGTDVAVAGNHEYDFGPEAAARSFAASAFPWLGTNVIASDDEPAEGLVASHVIESGGFKVGFFGLVTPETAVLSSPGPEIAFAPVVETARRAVEDLKAQGAELIVALTHQFISDDRTLAAEVEGIHLILGGHDHVPVATEVEGTAILKSSHNARHLAVADLHVERDGKTSLSMRPEWRLLSTAGIEPQAEIQALVDAHTASLDKELNVVIGSTEVELDSRRSSVRSRETNFGNLIAEAMRSATGADVGITNGGGIRGDRTYAAGTELTRRDIFEELPFGNVTVLLELGGEELRAALENGVSQVEELAGRFPQIAGMSLVYDPQAPEGARVVTVEVAGEALDPARSYTVATNNYMADGGDGYAALATGGQLIDSAGGTLMATMVMNYIEGKGTVAPRVDGRIRTR